ncbi:MAG: response regulator, partial [Planctomycetota bacterium]
MDNRPLILIIDDNRSNIGVIVGYLDQAGYRTAIATDAQTGLFRAKRVRPALILLDVRMPGKDGFEVCDELKRTAETATIPVVFLTAHDDVQSMALAFQSGGVDYLSKPLRREELLARVATHLEIAIYRQDLERMVAEKTAQLTEANEQLTVEVQERQQRLLRSKRQQVALAEFIAHPSLTAGDMTAAAEYLARRVADVLEVGRVGVWLLTEEGSALQCRSLYSQDTEECTSGEMLRVADYPIYFEAQKSQWVVASDDVSADPHTQELLSDYLQPLGITSMLDVPIRVGEEMIGVVCLEHIGPKRHWQEDELSFARAVSDRLAQVHLTHSRLQMEERLQQARKMEAIGQLAGGIAHDFNNQLSGVLGFAEMLTQRLQDPRLRRYAESIEVSALRAADMTQQLLAFSRKGKYLSVPVDLHHLLSEVVTVLQHSIDKRIAIKQILSASSAYTIGDPTQLQNALLNLAINGRDAMPEGGELIFSTDARTLDDAPCGHRSTQLPAGEYISVSVTDTGAGMSEETQQHMYEPFFTTKPEGEGTGMGLAAVYGTVKNHQGAIEVTSEVGKGTTFRLLLPAAPGNHAERSEDRSSSPRLPEGTHILLVDDEDTVREIGGEMLRDAGCTVTLASDGVEAVELYHDHWQTFDLVILDMVMPRMGGRDTFIAMRQINPGIKALLASGYSIEGEANAILREGVHA